MAADADGLVFVKYGLFTLNFILWVLGMAILTIAIWVRSDPDFWEYHDNLPIDNYYNACYVVMAVGVLLLIIGFMGCFGTAIDSPCMLITHFVTLLMLLVMECAAAGLVWKIADGDKLQEKLADMINNTMKEIPYNDKASRFMNLMQLHLECCGATSRQDYPNLGLTIPQSCSSLRTNNVYYYSCSENLRILLERTGALVGGIGLGLGFVQVVTMILTLCLFCTLRQDSTA